MPSQNIHKRAPHLFNLYDLEKYQPPTVEEIIRGGVLNAKGKMQIFGEAGSWKTMLCQHMSHCISNGVNFLTFPTNKAVIYRIQTELPIAQDKKRQMQYARASKENYRKLITPDGILTDEQKKMIDDSARAFSMPENIILRTESYIKIDSSFGMADLEKDFKLLREEFGKDVPIIAIYDPLYTLVTGNINDTQDSTRLIDNLNILQDRYNVSNIIVHHPRKSQINDGKKLDLGAEDSGGNAVFRNWCDTMIRVDLINPPPKGTGDRVKISFVKTRNVERALPWFDIRWNKDTLAPEILGTHYPVFDPEDSGDLDIRDIG